MTIDPLFYAAPVCDECWTERQGDRTPIRLIEREREVCHYCGRPTTSGIYQRARYSERASNAE